MHKILIIASFLLASCAANVRQSSNPIADLEMRIYGKGYGVMMASKAAQRSEPPQKILMLLSKGIAQVEKAGMKDACGSSGNPCAVYMMIGRLTRAAVYSALNRKDEAVDDLMWLHRTGLLRIVTQRVRFWQEKVFMSLHGHHRFEFLVRLYKT